MHIITKEGQIVEGQELDATEVAMLSEIEEKGVWRCGTSSVYIGTRERTAIIQYIVENFRISRRNPILAPEPFQPLPASPGTQYVNALTSTLEEMNAESEAGQ